MQLHLAYRHLLVEAEWMAIDSYRFLDFATRMVMKAWAGRQEPGVIPFTQTSPGSP
jgi:hypothetical protein